LALCAFAAGAAGQCRLVQSPSIDNAAIKLLPTDADALYARGVAELRAGLKTPGQTDLATARKLQRGIGDRYASMGLTP
jgi:hypothetical protein